MNAKTFSQQLVDINKVKKQHLDFWEVNIHFWTLKNVLQDGARTVVTNVSLVSLQCNKTFGLCVYTYTLIIIISHHVLSHEAHPVHSLLDVSSPF